MMALQCHSHDSPESCWLSRGGFFRPDPRSHEPRLLGHASAVDSLPRPLADKREPLQLQGSGTRCTRWRAAFGVATRCGARSGAARVVEVAQLSNDGPLPI
jgi:hypothetical protein